MLARQLWWVADRAKAMLMKVVVGESFLLLCKMRLIKN